MTIRASPREARAGVSVKCRRIPGQVRKIFALVPLSGENLATAVVAGTSSRGHSFLSPTSPAEPIYVPFPLHGVDFKAMLLVSAIGLRLVNTSYSTHGPVRQHLSTAFRVAAASLVGDADFTFGQELSLA